MDRPTVLLQGLRAKILQWQAFIKRAAYANSVSVEPGELGEFIVTVRWINKSGETGEYRKLFSREYVFGRTMQLASSAWMVQRCAGEYAREVVREVLRLRGVG